MHTKCIVVADGAHARFLSFDPKPTTPRGSLLSELAAMVMPDLDRSSGERYSGSRSESHGHAQGHGFTLDDHREQHDLDIARKFAAEVSRAAIQRARDLDVPEIIVIADPKMLGMLRPRIEEAARGHGIFIKTFPCELARRSVNEIEDHLRHEGLIPPRREIAS